MQQRKRATTYQQIGTQAATECEEQATKTLQANRHHQ